MTASSNLSFAFFLSFYFLFLISYFLFLISYFLFLISFYKRKRNIMKCGTAAGILFTIF